MRELQINRSPFMRRSVLAAVLGLACLLLMARIPSVYLAGGLILTAATGIRAWRRTLGAGRKGIIRRDANGFVLLSGTRQEVVCDAVVGMLGMRLISVVLVTEQHRHRAFLWHDSMRAEDHWQLRRWLLEGAIRQA